jgi:GT2 family glycosyltransferase
MVRTNYREVQLISMESNRGYPAAVNRGVRIADSEFIFILNSDVYLQAGAVLFLIEYLLSDEDIGIVGPAQFSSSGRPLLTIHPELNLINELLETILLWDVWRYRVFGRGIVEKMIKPRDVSWLSGAALLVRAAAMARAGEMDENLFMYGEEYDLQLRCRKLGWRIIYVPQARVIHEKSVSAEKHFGYRRLAAVTKSHYYVVAKHSGLKTLIFTMLLRTIRSAIRLTLGLPVFLWRPETAKRNLLEHLEVIKMTLNRSTFRWIKQATSEAVDVNGDGF